MDVLIITIITMIKGWMKCKTPNICIIIICLCLLDNSKSLRHVSDLMMGFLAKNCCNKKGKIMPILLTSSSRDHIPIFLQGYFAFEWPEQETRMENIIHRRPEFSIPVSHLREQAPQKVFGVKAVSP